MRNAILIATMAAGEPALLLEAGVIGDDVVVVDTSRSASSKQTISSALPGHAVFAYR